MEDLNPETAFNIVNRYLGWGDPAEGGIWFVGIEEASKWGDTEDDHPDEVQMDELERLGSKSRGEISACKMVGMNIPNVSLKRKAPRLG